MPSLDSLVCPKCHGPLTAHAGRELRCSRDGVRYPVVDGIPSFIIPGPDPVALPGCALSLVLPALNEGENLDRVLPELKKALAALGPTFEIIVVDGGSRDNTQEIVRKHAVRLVSQKLPGVGGAYRAGFEQARGAYVVTLDAAVSYLRTFVAMWRLRNSIASSDYDGRAYDSIIPLQRYWQRGRYRAITTLASGYRRVLDVGCGSSRIIGAIPGMVGLDIQLHKLRFARRYGNALVHGSIFELPFADESFDCVICSEVVEHIPAQEKPFDELARVLKTGGRLILGTPDYDRWRWRALEWLYGRLSPGGYADEHTTHYTRANLGPYLQGKGFAIESVAYVGGSEMIFSLKKLAPMVSPVSARPVHTAVRAERSVPAA